MFQSQKIAGKSTGLRRLKFRGMSLLEALLALGIGGVVLVQSVIGLMEYTEGVRVQAAASKISILNRAADRFADDNFSNLVASAPQQLPISVLEPYVAANIGADSFGSTYAISTRTYPITVPDPSGGTTTEQALQLLIVGSYADPAETSINNEITLRADIANAAGASSGFVAIDELSCSDGAGGTLPDGGICGAFGSYAIPNAAFPATNFTNAAVVSLITKGDSSVYGDQLYRYDYGDPELNTMHTDILMGENDLVDADEIRGVNRIRMDSGRADNTIEARADSNSNLNLRASANILLETDRGSVHIKSGQGTIVLHANGAAAGNCNTGPCTGDFVSLRPDNGKLRLQASETVFGGRRNYTFDSGRDKTGTGNVWADVMKANKVEARSVNSLFATPNDALRLNSDRDDARVIIGKRGRYNPDGRGGRYDLADGDLIAQHVAVQDVTCADCGGSLAAILPKWRHMGTYYIPDGKERRVPKPQCTDNRRRVVNTGGKPNNPGFSEPSSDPRYEQKIIIIPRQVTFRTDQSENVDFRFQARHNGNEWITEAVSDNGAASALAQTYCVFVGGNPDPAAGYPHVEGIQAGPNWVAME